MTDRDDEPRVEYRGTGFYVGLILAGILALLLVIMSVQNTDSVEFEFLGWDLELPLFALILIAVLIAVVVDELIGVVWRRRRRKLLSERQELGRLRKQAEEPTPPATPSSTIIPPETDDENESE